MEISRRKYGSEAAQRAVLHTVDVLITKPKKSFKILIQKISARHLVLQRIDVLILGLTM